MIAEGVPQLRMVFATMGTGSSDSLQRRTVKWMLGRSKLLTKRRGLLSLRELTMSSCTYTCTPTFSALGGLIAFFNWSLH